MLAAAAPVGVAVVSLVGDDQFLPRNLATSAPGLMLAMGALLVAGTVATRIVSTGLVVAVFAVGAVRDTESENQRTDYDAAAAFIDRTAGPEDVVLDIVGTDVGGTDGVPLSPPAYTLERALEGPHEVIEAADAESDENALRDAAGARLFLVGHPFFTEAVRAGLPLDEAPVDQLDLTGISPLRVQVFDVPSRGSGR